MPRVARLVSKRADFGTSPETVACFERALADAEGTLASAVVEMLEVALPEREQRRAAAAILGTLQFEEPDRLDRFAGTAMAPPSEIEQLAHQIATIGRR